MPLFARGRRAAGPLERSLAETLRAWAARDHLTGRENAGRRAILRELARAADEAARRMRDDDGSPWTASSCDREYRAALDAYAPPARPTLDPHAAELESQALADLEALANPPA
jgi:hypothetical protein